MNTLQKSVRRHVELISRHRGDQSYRLIFADWLDWNGFAVQAAGQRWAARRGKFPVVVGHEHLWLCDGSFGFPDHAKLPKALYDRILTDATRTGHIAEYAFLLACGRVNCPTTPPDSTARKSAG